MEIILIQFNGRQKYSKITTFKYLVYYYLYIEFQLKYEKRKSNIFINF